ncbi:HEPN domain-containing protein [Bradyrhizobium sp. ORS 86]|uniref:HEPN domain-containing protein n=1 Tax=Bradyrhizobium sp. ORS 86 TaxID=1685970 RepID=UPI00388D37E9
MIISKEPDFVAKSHGPTLGAFSRLFVKTGALPKHYGEMINRTQRARQVADYENAGVEPEEAEDFIAFAEELYEKALGLLPAEKHPPLVKKSPPEILVEAKSEEAARHALASAFCALAAKRGEVIHSGLAEELALYGTESTLWSADGPPVRRRDRIVQEPSFSSDGQP